MNLRDFPEGRLVEFRTSDGLMLTGFLCMTNRARIGVIHVHGIYSSFYRSNLVKTLAREFPKHGIAFMSIETRGSYTMAGFRKGRGRAQLGGGMERFEDCVKDIDAAVRFMRRAGVRHVYLDGISTGTQKITYYAYRKRKGANGLMLLAPVDDLSIRRKELGRRFNGVVRLARSISRKSRDGLLPPEYLGIHLSAQRFLSFADIKNAEARLYHYDLPRLKELYSLNIPVLSVFGSREQYAVKPVKAMNAILARDSRNPLSMQVTVTGANHSFHRHEMEAFISMLNWIRRVEGAR